MGILRTEEQDRAYATYQNQGRLEGECSLCTKTSVKAFRYWRILQNDFPYDKIAEVHHMIVPARHVTEPELTAEELKELQEIKAGYLNEHYEYIMEAVQKRKSIPGHFHLHLIVAKD